ncbi:MAG: hypothetical protein ABI678_05710 [Kofleriaceae bacterium]
MTYLALQFLHGSPVGTDTARLETLAALVSDPRWGVKFKLLSVGHVPGRPPEPLMRGPVAAKDLAEKARTAFLAPNIQTVLFTVSKNEVSDTAVYYVHTGRFAERADPSWGNTRWLAHGDAAAWISLQHEIVAAAGAEHAVIAAAESSDVASVEVWLSNRFDNGVSIHPDPGEIDRYARVRPQLGDKYLRAPRWGTYLSPRHLDAIGGRAKVVAEVQPATVREVGRLTYFQLTERIEDARSPAAEAKRAKFEALVAPLLPPA